MLKNREYGSIPLVANIFLDRVLQSEETCSDTFVRVYLRWSISGLVPTHEEDAGLPQGSAPFR
jgi:hypothetical protein